MTMFSVGVAAFLVGATSCTGANGSGTGTPPPETSTTGTTSEVVRVELHKTGGLAGVHETYIVERDPADQRRSRLFEMVGSQQFRTLNQSYSVPECRDQFFYLVNVVYTDMTKDVDSDDCGEVPQLLSDVRALVAEIGVQQGGR